MIEYQAYVVGVPNSHFSISIREAQLYTITKIIFFKCCFLRRKEEDMIYVYL